MAVAVSLAEFVGELDSFGDEWQVYLNRRTGEFFGTSAMDYEEEEEEEEEETEDDGRTCEERALVAKIREVMSSEDWLPLPSKFEVNEYGIMEDFCGTISDKILSADLLDTIGGRGTFARFKNMLERHGLLKQWYAFRDSAFRSFAEEWLEAHEIPYRE